MMKHRFRQVQRHKIAIIDQQHWSIEVHGATKFTPRSLEFCSINTGTTTRNSNNQQEPNNLCSFFETFSLNE
jgi:hypothetical protein